LDDARIGPNKNFSRSIYDLPRNLKNCLTGTELRQILFSSVRGVGVRLAITSRRQQEGGTTAAQVVS
jgi:hypothetical protein